jgi:hypothetical protein
MITAILNVMAIEGGRTIAFNVITDQDGANEVVSVTLEGQRFETLVQGGPDIGGVRLSIPLTQPAITPSSIGRYRVALVAESSGITSSLTDLHLRFKEPGPRGQPPNPG